METSHLFEHFVHKVVYFYVIAYSCLISAKYLAMIVLYSDPKLSAIGYVILR